LISVTIEEEHIQERRQTIVKNSEKEKKFVNKFRNKINNIDIYNILNSEVLESITQEVTTITEDLWNKHFKLVNSMKQFKE